MKSPSCEELLALIPAYAIGATDPEETRLVEAHLTACPELAAELKAFQALDGEPVKPADRGTDCAATLTPPPRWRCSPPQRAAACIGSVASGNWNSGSSSLRPRRSSVCRRRSAAGKRARADR